jgi:hypothetical protein
MATCRWCLVLADFCQILADFCRASLALMTWRQAAKVLGVNETLAPLN